MRAAKMSRATRRSAFAAVALIAISAAGSSAHAFGGDERADPITATHCPAWEMARVWYGYTQSVDSYPACGDLADHYKRHLSYPRTMLTTALASYYRRDVVEVQLRLNDLYYSPVTIDGHYGPQTADAVRHFQAVHKLTLDGKVGGETWQALFGNLGENQHAATDD